MGPNFETKASSGPERGRDIHCFSVGWVGWGCFRAYSVCSYRCERWVHGQRTVTPALPQALGHVNHSQAMNGNPIMLPI